MNEEVKIITLSAQKRKILKELIIKLERVMWLAEHSNVRYLAQDEMGIQPSIAFGNAPLIYRDGRNQVTAIGFRFSICETYLSQRLVDRYLKELLEFRDSLEPRTVYKFRKFSEKEIKEMMEKEKKK